MESSSTSSEGETSDSESEQMGGKYALFINISVFVVAQPGDENFDVGAVQEINTLHTKGSRLSS